MNEIKSNFFNFKKKLTSNEIQSSHYLGWNNLLIIKFEIIKNNIIDKKIIDISYPDLKDRQKIFVVTAGALEVKIDNQKNILNKLDAFDLASKNEEYEISAKENSVFFIICAKDLENQAGTNVFFNFKKDLEKKDLWGGQCISRLYENSGLTLVLFDLKKGFKFEDKGHKNEQITWLIEGKMTFHSDGESKILTSENGGIDIGPNHLHGGVSEGALGFDAFFPKRQEAKYRT
tara:strand:+ start:338 stop:1033 length:696 start_codon:yes stop_codon:yes gene_type:complete